jgi:hypothetical protein
VQESPGQLVRLQNQKIHGVGLQLELPAPTVSAEARERSCWKVIASSQGVKEGTFGLQLIEAPISPQHLQSWRLAPSTCSLPTSTLPRSDHTTVSTQMKMNSNAEATVSKICSVLRAPPSMMGRYSPIAGIFGSQVLRRGRAERLARALAAQLAQGALICARAVCMSQEC